MQQWNPYEQGCPSREVLDRIGDKWTVLILLTLDDDAPRRFTELRRRVGGISEKMLTQTLRGLERDGLVVRTVYPVVPPHVEYTLTDLGRTLLEPLRAIEVWSQNHMPDVLRARDAYAASNEAVNA